MKTIKDYYTQAYSSIRYKSKRRNEPYPDITKKALIDWLKDNGVELMWINYIESDCDKSKKPSIDRLNDYKGYYFSNMQLITWKENNLKGVNGEKHNKNSNNNNLKKKVTIIKDNLGMDFNSVIDCAVWLDVHNVSVSRALTGKRKTIKGYKAIYTLL